MPLPVSSHQPEFTADQIAQARKLAKQQSAPYRLVLRARLVLTLAEDPSVSHAQAAKRCGLRRSAVYKWRRRWADATPESRSLDDAPRPGRRPRFSP